MGQKRVTLVDLSQDKDEQQKKVSQKTVKKSTTKAMKSPKGTGRLVDKGEAIEDIVLEEEKPEVSKSEPSPTEIHEEEDQKVREKKHANAAAATSLPAQWLTVL